MSTQTIFEAYNDCKKKLLEAGIEDTIFEAKQIIKKVTGYNNNQILTRYTEHLTEFQQNLLTVIIKQRSIHYPLQYILGEWDFYGLSFDVGVGVLIPRQDTETLVDKALDFLKGKQGADVLDLCAGSGCIGITLAAKSPSARVTLLEKYSEAMRFCEKNIAKNNVGNATLVSGDVLKGDGSDKKYDLIVSNPPYITEKEMGELQTEVTFEPETALRGGEDGLDFYRAIIENYSACVKDGGAIMFEVGATQSDAVAGLLKNANFTDVGVEKDAAGIGRVVFGTAKLV